MIINYDKEACEDCQNCKYYYSNDETNCYDCDGQSEKCDEFIESLWSFRSMEGYR